MLLSLPEVFLQSSYLPVFSVSFFMTKDPTYMDLKNCNISPNKEFFFGTDTMEEIFFSMILYGGRISLFIGLISTVLSTMIAVIYGSFSGSHRSGLMN